MALDGAQGARHAQLCGKDLPAFEAALAEGSVCVGCGQEAALFAEIAEEAGAPPPLCVNLRETAGWSDEGAEAGPKRAALLAAAQAQAAPALLREIESAGLCVVIGAGQPALEAAQLLNRSLSVSLLLTEAADVLLPATLDLPLFTGRVAQASGALGGFALTVDGHAALAPSSRGEPRFGARRDGVRTACDVIVDLSAGSLFPRPEGREGYLRADPGDPAAVMRAVFEASALIGTFEKPVYMRYDAAICAHGRSRKTGCTNCLDACPAGAVASEGDAVRIDPDICGGCGACASHCPSGAADYAYPARGDLIGRVQAAAKAWRGAGGDAPALLLHDAHGGDLINAMARLGRGLPARVIPLALHAVGVPGHDALLAALAAGFSEIVLLGDPRKSGEFDPLRAEIALANALLEGLGDEPRVALIVEADPDAVETALYDLPAPAPLSTAAPAPLGSKREVARGALAALGRAGDAFALPEHAPYGAVVVNAEACTLCMACVGACPAQALRDTEGEPRLRFVEADCLQCGLCAATCPEGAIALAPRWNPAQEARQPVTLNADEPARCAGCGKPFVGKRMLERMKTQLAERHRMFSGEGGAALLELCDTCRLSALARTHEDPFAIAHRPRPRTSEDYKEAEKRGISVEDWLKDR